MGKPITTTAGGVCTAFPNVCLTPAAPSLVPIPYPSVGQLSAARNTASSVYAGSNPVVTKDSRIPITTGDAAGTQGVKSLQPPGGPVTFRTASATVFANGSAVVRLSDRTDQNHGNAVGVVLGGLPTVLVGD